MEGFRAYLSNFSLLEQFLSLVDIAIVALILYYAFLFIRGTKASKIVYGILFLILVVFLGRLLNLRTLNWVLGHLATMVVVAIPVVFQPELRRGLERLGRSKFLSKTYFLSDRKLARIVQEVVKALKILKTNKVGALIVIERQTGLGEYLESGTKLNADLTSELILNIFFPNSPLHDGAIIIQGDKIAAASCVLPLDESKTTYTYGTRHRAALGISENADAVVLVVSEERGVVSIVVNGQIKENVDFADLEARLIKLLAK